MSCDCVGKKGSELAAAGSFADTDYLLGFVDIGGGTLVTKKILKSLLATGRNAGLKYTYSSNTGLSDPGAGFLKFNNNPISGASALYISETDGNSNALAAYFATWDDSTSTIRGNLLIRKDNDPSIFAVVNITGSLTDNGAWDQFNITPVVVTGTLLNNDVVKIEFIPKGDKGDTGAAGVAGASGILTQDGWAVEFFDDYSVGAGPTLNKGFGWGADGAGSGLSIVSRNNVNGSENRLEIVAGQYGRKFGWGDDWHRLMICIILRINKNATFTSGKSYLGVCSGTTNMVASATTDNFIGHFLDAFTMTFNAGTKLSFFSTGNSMRFGSRRGTTTTDQGAGVGSDGRRFAAAEANRSMWLLDISRPVFATDASSITYSFGARETNSTQAEFPLSKHALIDVLDEAVLSTLAGNGTNIMLGGATSASFAFDQSTGKLDTLNISWVETFGLELSCIGVRKVY